MNLAKVEQLSAWMVPRVLILVGVLIALGHTVTVYSGRRSLEEQKELKRRGWTSTLKSRHLDGEAVDLIIEPRSGYAVAGKLWTLLGGKWGGNFKDPELAKREFQHFEHAA